MATSPPPCPGGAEWRTANLARRHAWWAETDPAKRPVPIKCGDHWHLTAPDARRDARPTPDTEQS